MSKWLNDLGAILQLPEPAARLASDWDRSLLQIKSRAQPKKAERVFVQIEDSPLMSVGGSSFISEALTAAGFHNIFSELNTTYPKVSREAVLAGKPTRILILDLIENEQKFKELKERWDHLLARTPNPAVVQIVSGDAFARCSFRLIQAIQELK
jgi:ABC-type Fe3+-hydroxamate transport system substrate-binding protein